MMRFYSVVVCLVLVLLGCGGGGSGGGDEENGTGSPPLINTVEGYTVESDGLHRADHFQVGDLATFKIVCSDPDADYGSVIIDQYLPSTSTTPYYEPLIYTLPETDDASMLVAYPTTPIEVMGPPGTWRIELMIVDDMGNESNVWTSYVDTFDTDGTLPDPPPEPDPTGISRSEPVPFGSVALTENWEIEVLQAIRGAHAWEVVQNANMLNDPPLTGREYVVVRVWVKNLSSRPDPVSISEYFFNTVGDENVLWPVPSVVEPEPELDAYLYEGGEFSGYIVMQCAEDEGGLLLVFDPPLDSSHSERRYLDLGF